jgi:hypothetical protein
MPLATLLAPFLAFAPLNFYTDTPYNPDVPRPEAVLGYEIGSRITTFRDQERVTLGIAARASARVKRFEFGKSAEGRPLALYAISSGENIRQLDAIRERVGRIAKGQADADLIESTPAIVWINECIHGNEPASFESAMPLIYNLAASQSPTWTDTLRNTVVLINPVHNPDGHERYAVWYNSVAVGAPEREAFEQDEPEVVAGRLNHYRFDLNRDRVAFSQPETRAEVAEFMRWNPQVYVDQHGQVDSYFFPPNPMAINANVDRARVNRWTETFGKATARAFDDKGYLYYIKEWFDLFYPGYTDSYTTLAGAIGMTHETDGGKPLARLREDGSTLTLRQGIDKHFTSAIAVIREAAANREALLTSYAEFKRSWAEGKAAGKFRRVVIAGNPDEIARLQRQLRHAGVASEIATAPFAAADAHDYWSDAVGRQEFPAGSLVVDIARPEGAIAKALLEPKPEFEPEFIEAQRAKKGLAPEGEEYPGSEGTEFYDTTGWSLIYAHNLRAWWCETAPNLPRPNPIDDSREVALGDPIGFAIPYRDASDAITVIKLLRAGLRGSVNRKTVHLPNGTFPAGTFFFLNERNEEGWQTEFFNIVTEAGRSFTPLTTAYPTTERTGPGSETMRSLRKPKIGVIFGREGSMASVGSTWWLLEQEFGLPFTPLTERALNGSLRDYTAIVVPAGVRVTANDKLKDWVEEGGHLVLLENYGWALGKEGWLDLEEKEEESQYLPGSIFRAWLDPRSALSYGYPAPKEGKIELAVPVAGDTFYLVRKKGGSIVTFDPDEKRSKLLSGWTFGEETEKALAGTTWLQDVPMGRGHVVVFTQDPTSRAMWPGLHKLFLNAVLFGG